MSSDLMEDESFLRFFDTRTHAQSSRSRREVWATFHFRPQLHQPRPLLTAPYIGAGALALVGYHLLQIGRRESDLPPGPPTIPLLGNLASFPTKFFFFPFTKWAGEYGDVYSLKLAKATVVVLNSVESVREVLQKQSSHTSDRPPSVVAEVVTGGLHMGTINANPMWRAYHRAANEILSSKACVRHSRIQAAETTQLTYDILSTPDDFFDHIERFAASIILSVVVGKRVPRRSSSYLQELYRVFNDWAGLLESGAFLNVVPFLKFFPPWKTRMARIKKWQSNLYFSLTTDLEDREARGTSNGCELEAVRSRAEEWGFTREMIGYLGGVIAEAGIDTTAVYVKTLILLMMAFPDAQQKAQAEIDDIIGRDRAPVAEDIERLPYVTAIIKEVHRFRPMVPVGFPRAASQDLSCEGYRIPKGSVIFTNVWGMLHDERLYDDPEEFKPERYIRHHLGLGKDKGAEFDSLGETNQDSPLRLLGFNGIMWGAGKRACPGRHLAKNSMNLTTMNLLWAFTFAKPVNGDGMEIESDLLNFIPGIINSPRHFKCTIRPRSPPIAKIIRQDFDATVSAFEPFEQELKEAEREWLSASRDGMAIVSKE